MTIKQHGGIFGRNPTFNNVTVDGTLAINGPITIGGDVFSGLDYDGTWNASTNTPTLTSSVGTIGHFYIVSVAGSTDLDGITNWGIGDWAVFNGSVWQRVEGGADGNFVNLSVTGTAEFAAGLAGTPSISHSGDPDTGIYWPSGANNLAIVTAGVNRVRVTSAGDVGIGTTSPTAKLEVDGSFTANGNVILGDASTDTVTVNGYMGVGGAPITSAGIYAVNSVLSGTVQYGIFSGPTCTSGATSQVNGVAGQAKTAAAAFTSANVSGFRAENAVKGAGSTITNLHGLYIADQTQGTNNYGVTSLVSSGANKWNIYASGTAANYFAGNVGIGTSSPDAKLRVNGAAKIGEGAASNTSKLMVNTVSGVAAGIQLFQDANESWIIQNPASTTALTFGNSGSEQMRLTSTGLGIGTSSPSVKLDVTGTSNGTTLELLRLSNIGTGANTKTRLNFYAASTNYGAITGGYGASAPEMVFDINTTAGAYIWNNNATERMRIDASGNLGLGVTPSAWGATSRSLTVNAGAFFSGRTDAFRAHLGLNAYESASDVWRYSVTLAASRYTQVDGQHQWFNAPSGTAGNTISFTQAMTLDASGNLFVGATSAAGKFAVIVPNSGALQLAGNFTNNADADFTLSIKSGETWIGPSTATPLIFANSANTERMRLDASGNLLVGTTSNPGVLNTSVVINSGANSLAGLVLQNNATGSSSTDGSHITIVGTELRIVNSENAPTLFLNNGAERARIPAAGGMVVGIAALATTATDGFLYVPTCAGTPTGTPTTQTGTAPIVIDTTNNKLYFYSGGQWRDAGP